MAINEADLNFYLSGGSANSNPNLSTGGAISSTIIKSMSYQLVNSTDLINGIQIIDAFGLDEGVDVNITWNDATKEITITQGLNSITEVLNADIKKAFFLNSNVYIILDIDFATIGTITNTSDLQFTYINNNLFDLVSPSEATNGSNNYRTIYIKNDNQIDTATNVKIYIDKQTIGEDLIYINIGTLNNTPSDTGNETVDPSGTWFLASNLASALNIVSLAPNDFIPVFIKREVPAGVLNYVADNNFNLSVVSD